MYLKLTLFVTILTTFHSSQVACQDNPHHATASNSGTASSQPSDLTRWEFEFPAMGTLVHLSVYGSDEKAVEQAIQSAQKKVNELAAILTDYDPASETRQLSILAAKSPTKVSDPLWEVLQAADRWNKDSSGALDCSLGSLTLMWRKYRRAGRVPTQDDVWEAKKIAGWQSVKLNGLEKTVSITDERVRIDFGAIGKGYIADQAYKVLVDHGIAHCMVNISGNMRCGLPPPGKAGWRIAISPIEQNGKPIQNVEIANQAIATSGDLWQFTLVDGVKRSHILDPKTGYGVVGPLAVTVIAPTAIDADALATTGCILDWASFSKLVESREGTAALRAGRPRGELVVERSKGFPYD